MITYEELVGELTEEEKKTLQAAENYVDEALKAAIKKNLDNFQARIPVPHKLVESNKLRTLLLRRYNQNGWYAYDTYSGLGCSSPMMFVFHTYPTPIEQQSGAYAY